MNHSIPGLWIPMIAYCNPLLSSTEKAIYGSLQYLNSKYQGGSTVSNLQLANWHMVSISIVESSLKHLKELEYITRETIVHKHKKTVLGNAYNITKSRRIYDNPNPVWDILAEMWNKSTLGKNEEDQETFAEVVDFLRKHRKSTEKMMDIINFIEEKVGTPEKQGVPTSKTKGQSPRKPKDIYKEGYKEDNNKRKRPSHSFSNQNQSESIMDKSPISDIPISDIPISVKKKKKLPSSACIKFTRSFYRAQKTNGGKQKIPLKQVHDGARVLDQLIHIEKYDLEKEIIPAIEWAMKNKFWSKVIRSLARLRDKNKNKAMKFDNMFDQFIAERNEKPKTRKGGKIFEEHTGPRTITRVF